MVFDNDRMFADGVTFTSASATTDLNRPGLFIKTTGHKGMAVRLVIPAAGTGTLLMAVQESGTDVDTDYITIAQSETFDSDDFASGGEVYVPFASDADYVRVAFTVGGTAPSWASLVAGLVLVDNSKGISRTVDWSDS